MKSNPIHKAVNGGMYTRSGYRPSYVWAFTCPVCGKEEDSGYYRARNSRKGMKDALYSHTQRYHTGDSGEVPSS